MKHNKYDADFNIILNDIVNLLKNVRNISNIYDLVSNEYLRLDSTEYSNDITACKPTISFNFKKNKIFDQEINKIIIEEIDFSFNLIKISNNSFEVNYKVMSSNHMSNFKLISLQFIINFKQHLALTKNINKHVISNYDKTYNNIIVIKDISGFLSKMNNQDEVGLRIYIKITFIDSLIQNYIVFNYKDCFNDQKLKILSKYNLVSLLSNPFLIKENEDQLVVTIGTWLLDEKNINEEICNLFDLVKWKNVTIDVLFEFIIKFASILTKFKLEGFFTKILKQLLEEKEENISKLFIKISKILLKYQSMIYLFERIITPL